MDDQGRVTAVEVAHPNMQTRIVEGEIPIHYEEIPIEPAQTVTTSALLDVLTQDPICPVCQIKGTPVSDDRGIAYRHEFRHYLCRVTPRALERA